MSYVYQPYPRMLYRHVYDQQIVQDYGEEQAALADGWRLTPNPEPSDDAPVVPDPAVVESPDPPVVKRGPGRPRKVVE
jgi:hypothetical protein